MTAKKGHAYWDPIHRAAREKREARAATRTAHDVHDLEQQSRAAARQAALDRLVATAPPVKPAFVYDPHWWRTLHGPDPHPLLPSQGGVSHSPPSPWRSGPDTGLERARRTLAEAKPSPAEMVMRRLWPEYTPSTEPEARVMETWDDEEIVEDEVEIADDDSEDLASAIEAGLQVQSREDRPEDLTPLEDAVLECFADQRRKSAA